MTFKLFSRASAGQRPHGGESDPRSPGYRPWYMRDADARAGMRALGNAAVAGLARAEDMGVPGDSPLDIPPAPAPEPPPAPTKAQLLAELGRPPGLPASLPGEEPPAGYEDLAEKLGLRIPLLEQRARLRIFNDLGLPLYDNASVRGYLERRLLVLNDGRTPKKTTESWTTKWEAGYWLTWRALHADHAGASMIAAQILGGESQGSDGAAYQFPVPMNILEEALQVERAFEAANESRRFNIGKPSFFVSDIAYRSAREVTRDPDPFIACVAGGDVFVFGVWDEPGYVQKAREA